MHFGCNALNGSSMNPPLPEANPELVSYLSVTFGLGLAALLHYVRVRPWRHASIVTPWEIGGIPFGIAILMVFSGVLIIQSVANFMYQTFVAENVHSDTWRVIISGYLNYLIFLTFFILSWIFKPEFFAKNINVVSLPCKAILGRALYGFLLSLPFVYCWGLLMIYLQQIGFSIEKQSLVGIIAETRSPILLILLVFVTVVIAPISEELLFRGAIYRFIKGQVHPRLALMLSALIFSLMHFNTMAYVPLFILGLLLARSYEVSGNIAVPIVFHALFNANTLILIALQTV